jgi:hypothetical protein
MPQSHLLATCLAEKDADLACSIDWLIGDECESLMLDEVVEILHVVRGQW